MWNELPEEFKDFLVRLFLEIGKESLSNVSKKITEELEALIGVPTVRLEKDLNKLVKRIESTRELKIRQKIKRPSAEMRHLYHLQNLLNLVRREMINYNSFFYMQPSIVDDSSIMLFQTHRAMAGKIDIERANILHTDPIKLKKTEKWKIVEPSLFMNSDFKGVSNTTLFVRYLPFDLVYEYAPKLKECPPALLATALNVFLRQNGGQDPWPKRVGRTSHVVPTIFKFDWNRVSMYSSYAVGETIHPLPGKLEVGKIDFENTISTIERELIKAILIHHPDWDPYTLTKLK